MIKTLQISSILAVIVAGVLFVSSVVFGVHQDNEIEEFLKSPGAKEQFLKGVGGPKRTSREKTSPLVGKAQQFANILNPPAPVRPKIDIPKVENKGPATPPPPPPTTAKYKLYGTAVCESDPEKSIALIDEPGKGLVWVRQGTVIMGTTIEQILDGKISVNDSRGKVEMSVEEGPAPASAAGAPPRAAGAPSVRPAITSSNRITGSTSRPGIPPRTPSGSGRRPPVTPESIRSRMTSAENARLSALGDRLKAARDAKAGKTTAQLEAEAKAKVAEEDEKAREIMKKLAESAAKEAAANKPPTSTPGRSATPPRPPVRR
ncbi:MAG: hypothetical protein ACYS8Z_00100 [Planctomycetota bacterium]|jgi:hypothetical protein